MLSIETEARLAKLLTEIGRGEGRLELERQALTKENDYSPYACFLRIDRSHKGWVNSVDLLNFLRDNGIFASETECHYLVKFFDVDLDGRLDYLEFLHIMFPCTNPELRAIASQKPDYGVDACGSLPYSVEKQLAHLIEKEIAHHRKIEPLRQDLAIRSDYSPSDCLRQIDVYNTGVVELENLSHFLRRNSYFLSEDELGDIIRRIDKDADNVINLPELKEAIDPVEPSARPPIRVSYSPSQRSPARSQVEYSGSPIRSRAAPAVRRASPTRLSASPVRQPAYTTPLKGSGVKAAASYLGDTTLSTTYATPAKIPPAISSPHRGYDYSPERTKFADLKHYALDSPMKPLEEEKFVQMVKDQISIESDLEKAKKDLSLCSDFNLIDAFRLIDPSAKGYVTTLDLQDNLKSLGVSPSYQECSLFFRRYDNDNDGRLRYSDFTEAFTPKDREFSDLIGNRPAFHSRHLHHPEDYFEPRTRQQLRKCWNVHFELEQEAELLRQRMHRRPSFNVHEAFKTTDRISQGYITVDQVRALLNEHKYYPSEKELITLMDRYDRNKDGKISYSEVSHIFQCSVSDQSYPCPTVV